MDYILSPITIGLLVITLVSIVVGIRASKSIRENINAPTGSKFAPLAFMLAVTAYIAVATVDAAMISRMGDKIFPLTIGIATLIGCVALLIRMFLKPATDDAFIDLEAGGEDAEAPHGLWSTLSWFVALLALTGLFGFVIAAVLFLLVFFRLRGGLSWMASALYAAGGIAFILFLASVLGRDFPPGLLQSYVQLPWPLT